MSWSTSLMREWTTRPLRMTELAAEREPDVVQGVEMQGKTGLGGSAGAADFPDEHGLEDHDFGLQLAENHHAFRVALVLLHRGGI